MGAAVNIAIAGATVIAMEGVAYAGHRWGMHGPLWFLHRSHHEPRTGRFERNDWFGAVGAVVSITLFYLGVSQGLGAQITAIATGITLYGAIYFGFHDILVHRRLAHHWKPRSSYLRRIMQAHRLHHAIGSREGAVSFGFVYAPPVAQLKRQLASNLASGAGRARSKARG
jgi:beta-carotene 3-hydroxylase